jgi:hypothetical protein
VVDERPVGLVADGRDEGNRALGGGAHHRLVVEAPQILDRAAAAGHDEHVGARDRPAGGERVEAADRGRDLLARGLALHPHGPDEDAAGEAVLQAVEDVADDGPRGRGHDADDPRQVGQLPLALGPEQALRGEPAAALLEERHEGADPGRLQGLDHDLVGGLAREGGDAPRGDDLEALLRLHAQAREGALPHHASMRASGP